MVEKRTTKASWENIEAILAVGRAGSVREAAQSMGVSHTTLARRIQQAEQAMGVIAFVRGPTGYTLTTAGQTIVQHARDMEEAAENIERAVRDVDEMPSGLVRITLPLPVLELLIAPFLKDFHHDYPGIQIEFQVDQAFSALEDYQSDIAIRFSNDPSPDLVGTRVGKLHEGIFVDTGLLESLRRTKPERLPFIAWSNDTDVRERLAFQGFDDVDIRFLCEDVQGQKSLALAGQGIAILPCIMMAGYDNMVMYPGTRLRPVYDIWVLTHPNLKSSARIRVVSRRLAALIRENSDLLTGAERGDGTHTRT